jgi:hypothetical protein
LDMVHGVSPRRDGADLLASVWEGSPL